MADNEDGINPITRKNEFYLSFFTFHDTVLALCLVVSSFVFAPYFAFIYPFLVFLFDAVFSKRLSPQQKSEIQSRFNLPRTILLRRKKKSDCYVFSIPFISIMFLGDNILDNLGATGTRGNILHELGHHRRHDMMVLMWLRVSLLFWVLLSLLIALAVLMIRFNIFLEGVEADAENIKNTPLYTAVFVFAAIAIFNFILFAHYHYVHRREYVADTFAYKHDKKALMEFLHYKKWGEKIKTKRKIIEHGLSMPTHPGADKRIALQEHGLKIDHARIFFFAFVWATLCTSTLLFTNMPAVDPFNYWGIENMQSAKLRAMTVGLTAFIFTIGYGMLRISNASGGLAKGRYFTLTTAGYVLGILCPLLPLGSAKLLINGAIEYSDIKGIAILLTLFIHFFILAILITLAMKKLKSPAWLGGLVILLMFQVLTQMGFDLFEHIAYFQPLSWLKKITFIFMICITFALLVQRAALPLIEIGKRKVATSFWFS